jgi:hypothetical protein
MANTIDSWNFNHRSMCTTIRTPTSWNFNQAAAMRKIELNSNTAIDNAHQYTYTYLLSYNSTFTFYLLLFLSPYNTELSPSLFLLSVNFYLYCLLPSTNYCLLLPFTFFCLFLPRTRRRLIYTRRADLIDALTRLRRLAVKPGT